MRYQGKITDWKDDRGFGFITPSSGGAPVFVHISAFKKGQRRPAGNELVTYELLNDPKKGFRAQNVMFFGVFQPSVRKEGRRTLKPFIVAILVVSIGIYA
jgi:cold shock CspA family protein